MRYYLGLGSNLGNRRRNLARALGALGEAGVAVLRMSAVYRTQPVDIVDQPWFYNLAVEAETSLPPAGLLRLLKRIEKDLGRTPGPRSGPRPIDIDIILAGRLIVRTPQLKVPHPRMEERNFVLVPLAEIAPRAVHPVLKRSISGLLAASPDRSAITQLGPLGPEPTAAAGRRRRESR